MDVSDHRRDLIIPAYVFEICTPPPPPPPNRTCTSKKVIHHHHHSLPLSEQRLIKHQTLHGDDRPIIHQISIHHIPTPSPSTSSTGPSPTAILALRISQKSHPDRSIATNAVLPSQPRPLHLDPLFPGDPWDLA